MAGRAGRQYLGLDASTQSLSAMVIEVAGDGPATIVLESSLNFDAALPHYGTRHGVLPRTDSASATSSPVMWAEALDRLLPSLAGAGLDPARLAAISGAAQQHGSVYLNARATSALARFDPSLPLAPQLAPLLSRSVAPIWMDTSTSVQCASITSAVGGAAALASRTGSRAFERFTGPQIRKFATEDPGGYAATDRIHLVSSFMASLLAGGHAALEPGDASGANLMDLRARQWWDAALDATAPGLEAKLPPIAAPWTIVGRLSPYWQARHGLPAAKIIAWSGDNPCTLIGVGLVREGRVAISLGTSDTVFGLMKDPHVDPSGTGHVFGSPTGDYMGLTCFSNGSLARERIREAFGLSWPDVSRILRSTPPGNGGRVLIPWFEPEITPRVPTPGVHRYRLSSDDAAGNVRGVIEAQMMSRAIHSRWMGIEVDTIHATGGAAVNLEILRVISDVFGAAVHHFPTSNSAALGAALRAWHADALDEGRPLPWEAVTSVVRPDSAVRIAPDPDARAIYRRLLPLYAACEAHALGRGPDPTGALETMQT
ncbi:MAG: FGGY-family carbohydrate kinase [Acidobacteriota bacterium]